MNKPAWNSNRFLTRLISTFLIATILTISTFTSVLPAFAKSDDSNGTVNHDLPPFSDDRSLEANDLTDNATWKQWDRNTDEIFSLGKTEKDIKADEGGKLQSASGKIVLNVPKNSVANETSFTIHEYMPQGSTGMQMVNLIELNANEVISKQAVSRFDRDLELVIHHTSQELAGVNRDSINLFYLDEATLQWVPVSSSFDNETLTLTARISHFSKYGEMATPLESGPGKILASQVGLHSGSATYSYPLEVLPGPGGFKPSLALTYNSASVNEMKNRQDVGSWVGIGWSLKIGSISYNEASDSYSLDLGNGSYKIVPDSDGTTYHTMPDEHLKITRDGNTWTVYDTGGNYYRFGGTAQSIQYYDTNHYYRWDLTIIRDANGNEATISWVQNISGNTVRSAYPSYINYGVGGLNEIQFIVGSSRGDNPQDYGANLAPKIMENRRLDAIQVWDYDTLVRTYTFDYTITNCTYSSDYGGIYYAGSIVLDTITQYDYNDEALPETSFTYQTKRTYCSDLVIPSYVGNPGNPATLNRPYLTQIDNGYGGQVLFSYTETPSGSPNNIWTREIVTGKTIVDGIGANQTYSYTYDDGPIYLGHRVDMEFKGFGQVTEEDSEGNYTIHRFYTTGNINGVAAERLTGREYVTQWYSANDTLLKETSYEWAWEKADEESYYYVDEWRGYVEFDSPFDIAISNSGNVYVSDYNNHRIQVFDTSGNYLFSWGEMGSGQGQFFYPCGIDVYYDGYMTHVYVADRNNNRIQKFGEFGNYEDTYTHNFNQPHDVSVDPSTGSMYVVDSSNNRVVVLDLWGGFVRTWGTRGSGNGQFYYPRGISVYGSAVYVADTYNNRVQQFTLSGTYVRQWGSAGSGNGQFSFPFELTATSSGVFVADTINHRIQKFTLSGTWQATWGAEGGTDGLYRNLKGLELIGGYLYIADTANDRVQVIDASNGDFTFKWGLEGSTGSLMTYPFRMAVSDDNLVYICDLVDTRVLIFDTKGDFIKSFNGVGDAGGAFEGPRGIDVDSHGFVYISDENGKILKYSSGGTYQTHWNRSALDIAISDNDTIYALSGNNVYVYNTSGTLLDTIGLSYQYTGLTVSPDGSYLYACGHNYSEDFIHQIDTSDGSIDNEYHHLIIVGLTDLEYSEDDYVYLVAANRDTIGKLTSSLHPIGAVLGTEADTGEFSTPQSMSIPADGYIYTVEIGVKRIQKFSQNWTVQLKQVEETIGEKTTRVRYEYDEYGNVVTEFFDGDIDNADDNSTVHRLYYPNVSLNILSKPARERVYAGTIATDSGTDVRKETLFYYDGNNSSLATPPTEGNVTRINQSENITSSVDTYYTYDTYGNTLSETDPNGNSTNWTYEPHFHTYIASTTYPVTGLNDSNSYEWYWTSGNDNGTVKVSYTDVNGNITDSYYDSFDQIRKIVKPGDTYGAPSFEYQYNNWGTVNQQHIATITKIDASHSAWQKEYFDGLGRVVQVHSQGESGYTIVANTVLFNDRGLVDKEYVAQTISGNLTSYLTPDISWKYTSHTYDTLGRIISQTDADGTTVSHDYSVPWREVVTDASGNTTRYYYDAFQRLVTVEEMSNPSTVYATTEYTYDVLGNLIGVEDDHGNITSMNYDRLSRKTGMTDPDMGTWSYGYDDNGNLTSQTDAKGQTITMVYDEMNRLTNKNYPVGSGMTNVVYTFDQGTNGKGQRTGMIDASGNTTYEFDTRGRLITESREIDSVSYNTSFTYDGLDRVETITYPTGEVVTNGYNERGLPYSIEGTSAGDIVTSTLYNGLGLITDINLGNGLKTTYGYYGTGGAHDTTGGYYGRLWEITTEPQAGGAAVQQVTHTWDANGNLLVRDNLVDSETEYVTYDSLDRLTGVTGAYSVNYTYDEIGNILSTNGAAYTYNGTQPHAVDAVGALTYSYDANGNMIFRGTPAGDQTLTWDAENRPASISYNGTSAAFVYDGAGKRVKKIENGVTTLYINQYYEKNVTTGNATSNYYLGGKLIATSENGTVRYLHQDHLSGTSAMSDAAGDQINSTVTYYPFGTTRSGSVPTDRLYTGQRLDDTGLYFYNARYYEPGIGKFLSPDSSGPDLQNPQSLNKYSYCFNNPLKYNDPSGKWPNWSKIGKAITQGVKAAVNVVKENIDVVHTVLDVAGMIPGVGEAFDAVNGVIYAAEGDFTNAGLSFAACIPVVGSAATGVKLVSKTVDKVAGLAQAAKKLDVPETLFHFTSADPSKILSEGLNVGKTSKKVFATSSGNLHPLQASIDLALPPNLPYNHLIGIDVSVLRKMGIDIPSPHIVSPSYGKPGGGIEYAFSQMLPPEALFYIR